MAGPRVVVIGAGIVGCSLAASAQVNVELDEKVENFLTAHRDEWHDLNVPFIDGQTLYDLILKNKYTSALEIGTSTGHSTIWLAWAMSKTGGKVTTIELDEVEGLLVDGETMASEGGVVSGPAGGGVV